MKRLVFAVLGVLFFALAAATVGQAAEPFVEHWVSGNNLGAMGNYWTNARMMNAKPYPMPHPKGQPPLLAPLTPEEPPGPPGSDPSSNSGQVSALLSEGESEVLALSGAVSELSDSARSRALTMSDGYNYPPPHTTFKVSSSLYGTTSSNFPYRAIGKVFFTKGGINYVCSGSSIGGRAVLTAGHCLSDGKGTFHSNWIFVPAYKKNSKPYGTWTAYYFVAFDAWHKKADNSRDVGFAVVKDLSGVKLSAKVGYLGFSFNQSRVQHWNNFGYPQAAPWDGQFLVETQASYAATDTSYTPNTIGIGTTQTDGCSGGPWIRNFVPDGSSAGASNYANGVNGYAYTTPNQPNQIYSPYFDSAVKSLKDAAVAK